MDLVVGARLELEWMVSATPLDEDVSSFSACFCQVRPPIVAQKLRSVAAFASSS